ncbi:MAG: UvrD-helicase domain-containing protein [Verrucomicrobia bacterium]|nr:UvrD-helicase domain-containing protein [Verrucomicrobiota bacterium]
MSDSTYTPEQRKAIAAQGSVSVRAGAGSGKTRVLTARYRRALCDGLKPGAVLGVTFTDKAAAEMRDRIRRGLDELGLSPTERAQMREALVEAPISTIHSLCAAILREFAIEAGIDPAFEIADEDRALQLARAAIEQTIAAAVGDTRHPVRPSIESMLSHYTRAEIVRLVEAVMHARRYLSPEAAAIMELPPPDMIKAWGGIIRREASTILTGLLHDRAVADLLDALDAHASLCADPDDKLLDVVRTALLEFETVAEDDDGDPLPIIAALSSAYLTKDGKPRRYGNLGAKGGWADADIADVRELAGRLAEHLTPIASLRDATLRAEDATVARLVHALWRLVTEADRACTVLKGDGAVLDFDDLEAYTIALLESKNGPGVLDALQSRYRLLLVDESQDLNLLQYRLIELLAGGASTDCFVVGDPQQSIYGFRNADVRLLDRIEQDLLGDKSEAVRLALNFRSSTPLVAFANRLFPSLLTGGEAFDVTYQPMAAHRADEARTHIELLIAAPSDDAAAGQAGLDPAAATVAQRIAQLVDGGCLVPDSAPDVPGGIRPARYGDVAILLRTKRNLSELRIALRAHGLPHLVYKGTGFYQSPEVRDVYMALRFLADPSYDLGLAAMLRSPLFALSDDALFLIAHRRTERTLLDALERNTSIKGVSSKDAAVLEHVCQCVRNWRELVDCVRPSALLQRILDDTGAWGTYASIGADGNLRKLVRIVRTAQRPSTSLAEIVDLLHEHIHRRPREGTEPESSLDEDAVKIMTIHAAKGLEFPVVFVLGLEDNLRRRPAGPSIQIDPDLGIAVAVPAALQDNERKGAMFELIADRRLRKELAEDRRLLYVACTRARDHLFLVDAVGNREAGESWRKWILDALQLEGRLPDSDGHVEVALGDGVVLSVKRSTYEPRMPSTLPARQGGRAKPLPRHPVCDPDELARWLAPIAAQTCFPVVTVSQLRDFEHCPRLYHARYVAGITLAPPLLAPNDEGNDTFDSPSDSDEQRILGIVVHALLEQHKRNAQLSLDEAARRAAGHETLDDSLAARVASRALAIVERFQASDAARGLLDVCAWQELPFALRAGGAVVRGRIDRLIPERPPVIVDFKTPADPKAAEQASLDDAYGLQMRVYALAASRLLKTEAARTMIVLPETARAFEWRYGPADLRKIEADLAHRLEEVCAFNLAKRLETVSPCGRCPACRTPDA